MTRITAYQSRVSGDEVKRFLLTHFKEKPDQRPEFQMGFAALRRIELIQLAQAYGIEINPDDPKELMLPKLEQYWLESRFPKAPSEAETTVAALFAQLTPQQIKGIAENAIENATENPTAAKTSAGSGEDPGRVPGKNGARRTA